MTIVSSRQFITTVHKQHNQVIYKRCIFNAIVQITLKSIQMLATQKKRLRTRIQHPVHGGMLHVTTPRESSPKNRSQYQNYQKVVPQYY